MDGYSETNMVDGHIAARADLPDICRLMWFVEPMAWMRDVTHQHSGKLHCPKCLNKIGSFSWIMGMIQYILFYDVLLGTLLSSITLKLILKELLELHSINVVFLHSGGSLLVKR